MEVKEFFLSIWNTLPLVGKNLLEVGKILFNNSEPVKNLAETLISIIGGVCAISGILWLKDLKNKQNTAIFGFWSQLVVKLKILKKRLESDYSLINNLYPVESQEVWTNIAAPPNRSDIEMFMDLAQETLTFIKDAEDQMPAYRGWTNDYAALIDFLDDVLYYDISLPTDKFKFLGKLPVSERNTYVSSICSLLSRLIEEIEKTQKQVEKKLCRRPKRWLSGLKKRISKLFNEKIKKS